MSCKVWDWILYPSNCSLGMDYEALLESRKRISRASRSSSSPSKICCAVHWRGPCLEHLHAPSRSTDQQKYYDLWHGVHQRGVGGHSCIWETVQHHKVWLQSHTLAPKLDLNESAWELRAVQVQPKRINPWFRLPNEDREGLTTLDDPLLLCLLCHQSLGCARGAYTVWRQMGCSYLWDPNASVGNAAYTLFPFSGPRLPHWWWEKHKFLLSVQISGSSRDS